ncbi:hypothetical protein B2G50_14165 [Leptospira interrogans serovar Canicola]|nr:hypothetical protein B2G50_14165 [Leptospira interrogans serovar Canicola]
MYKILIANHKNLNLAPIGLKKIRITMNLHINYKRNKKINLAHFDPSDFFIRNLLSISDRPRKCSAESL